MKEWLEMSAGIFNPIEKGKADQPLINLDFPAYNFDVIDGVTYKIDLSQPPKYDPKGAVLNASSNRIVDLALRWQADRSRAEIRRRVEQLSCRRRRQFPEINGSKVIYQAPDTNRDVIVRFIHEQGTINPTCRLQLELCSARRHDRDLRDRAEGEGSYRRREGSEDRAGGRGRRRLREVPDHALRFADIQPRPASAEETINLTNPAWTRCLNPC